MILSMNRTARLQSIKNYALYYGIGREQELVEFDMVIVEPKGQTKESIIRLKESGTLVLAYLSVMEIHASDPEAKLLRDADFLTKKGQRLQNPRYENWLADLSSERWNSLLTRHAVELINDFKYDGLFLDTIGDVEGDFLDLEKRDLLLVAAAHLLRRFRSVFPEQILIQNCGMERLLHYTAQYIDGICWENPCLEHRSWFQPIIDNLSRFKRELNLQVFFLLEENTNTRDMQTLVKRIAAEKGFLSYTAPSGYVSGIK